MQARSRDRAVACEPERKGGPIPPLVPLPAGHSFLALRPPLALGPKWVASVAQLAPTIGHCHSSAPGDRGCHLPTPPPPPPLIPASSKGPFCGPRSEPVVACAPPLGPTSWQFVVVCRVLLSCKSQSRCSAGRRWVFCFMLLPSAFAVATVSAAYFFKAGKSITYSVSIALSVGSSPVRPSPKRLPRLGVGVVD